jgi:hypothetical protein
MNAHINEDALLASLPKYVRNDILALVDGYDNGSTVLDCLYNEVQGSINSALWDKEISKETADYLWDKYL